MIHLHGCWYAPIEPKRCDTRALLEARARVRHELQCEKDAKRINVQSIQAHNERVRQRRSTPYYLQD